MCSEITQMSIETTVELIGAAPEDRTSSLPHPAPGNEGIAHTKSTRFRKICVQNLRIEKALVRAAPWTDTLFIHPR